MRNKICLHSNTYHGFSLDEALEGAANAGFRYMELAAVKGYTEHVDPDMTDDMLAEVKKKLNDHGIEAIGLSGHSNIMDEEGVNHFLRNVELAHRLGCKYITTSTGDAHDDEDVIEDDLTLIKALEPIVAKCEEYGITLVIETHGNNYATGKIVKNLINQIDSDFIKVNYDTGNVIFYGKDEPYDDLRHAADEVAFIHLKDKAGAQDEWNFPAIGNGDIDMQRVFNILEKTGCTAPLSVEIEFTEAGPSGLDEVNQAVKDSYNNIQKLLQVRN